MGSFTRQQFSFGDNNYPNFEGLYTYADNAAALLGGLIVGDLYKTATGEVRVVV